MQRTKTIDYLINQRLPTTKQHLLEILSNDDNEDFPVYRTGKYPDALQTLCTGIY